MSTQSDYEREERRYCGMEDHKVDPPPRPAPRPVKPRRFVSSTCRHTYPISRVIHRGTEAEQKVEGEAHCGAPLVDGRCPWHPVAA